MALLDKMAAQSAASAPQRYEEIERICAIPVDRGLDEREQEEISREFVLAESYEKGFRLLDTQANAVRAFVDFDRLFAPIGVGWGKTLISLLVAHIGIRMKGMQRVVLCVPPQVYPQLMTGSKGLKFARKHTVFNIRVFGMGNPLDQHSRKAVAKSREPGLYVLPYSCLSTPDAAPKGNWPGTLTAIQPDMIVLDEAHSVSSLRAARTRRLRDYLSEYRPVVVAMSGTMTSKSVQDFHHLIKSCLGDWCPLPLQQSMAFQWGRVLDTNGTVDQSATGPVLPLARWAQRKFPNDPRNGHHVSGFRNAFRLRMTTVPGVVATGDRDLGIGLSLCNEEIDPKRTDGHDEMDRLIDRVEVSWLTPNGDEIDHAFHTFKWLYELHNGFYNQLLWPEPDVLAKRRGCSESAAAELIERAQEQHELNQEYTRMLRSYLEDPLPGLDTPMMVGGEFGRNGPKHLPTDLYHAWKQAHEAKFEGMPERESEAVRVCSFKIDKAAQVAEEWVRKDQGGLLWVFNIEMGEWLHDVLTERGLDHLYCPAGNLSNKEIIKLESGKRITIASITAHGEGKDLQHYQNQFFLQWPRSARQAEQVLGRCHRNGQTADHLYVQTCHSSEFEHRVFAACLNDSVYQQQNGAGRRKVIYADHDPEPKIYTPEFLRERGIEGKQLTSDMWAVLETTFGTAVA